MRGFIQSCILVYGAAVRTLDWGSQLKLITKTFANIKKNRKTENIGIKLICECLENANIGLTDIVTEIQKKMVESGQDIGKRAALMAELISSQKVLIRRKIARVQKEESEAGAQLSQATGPKPTNLIGMEDEMVFDEIEDNIQREKEENKMEIEDLEDLRRTKGDLLSGEFTKVQQITKLILLPLRHHMKDVLKTDHRQKKIRLFAAIAITKIIRRLPLKVFVIEFHRLIRNITEVLKNRDFEVRNNARKVLLKVSSLTGPYFLFMIIRELQFMLQKGYMKHILNYTVFLLLKNMVHPDMDNKVGDYPHAAPGSLDQCLKVVLPLFFDELIGELEEEKAFFNMMVKDPEYKKKKALTCFQLLGGFIDFPSSVGFVINSIKEKIEGHTGNIKKLNTLV